MTTTNGFDRRLLSPMMLGSILNPINSTIIAVALVPIGTSLGAPARETTWLVTGLYLATAIGQPLMGRLVDAFGARRIFLIGAALTLVAGLLGTFAPNIWVLVAARVVLGFGTCAGYPSAMRLIRDEGQRTGIHNPAGVLSILSITTQTINVLGPVLGGLLIDFGGWRSTLAINIVLGIAGLVLGVAYLPTQRGTATSEYGPVARNPRNRFRIDLLGIALFASGMVSLLLFLIQPGWSRLWLAPLGLILGVVFVLWERRQEDPFIDLTMLTGNRPLMLSYARAVMAALVSYGYLYGYTQWLQESRGLSASLAGLLLLPTFGVSIVVVAVFGKRGSLRVKLLVGAATQVVVCAIVLTLSAASPIAVLLVVSLALGIPQGLVNLTIQNAVYYQARGEQLGAASGLLRTFMYVGAIGSSAASGLLFGHRASTAGLHGLGLIMLVAAVILLLISAADRSLRGLETRS